VDGRWTIDELVAEVAMALHGSTAPDGRVRDVPDARAVRWYSTIGLMDRPATMRGRTALYGQRHLLQLVAVKRRQAEGRRLADIQAELTGATDEQLHAIARLDAPAPPPVNGADPAVRPRFWAERPAMHTPAAPETPALLNGVQLPGGAVLMMPGRPAPEDIPAIVAAARPLLAELAARNLLTDR
jgi:DNA-binding transcriptional MerR regulator